MQGSFFSRSCLLKGALLAFLLWFGVGFLAAEETPLKIPRVRRAPRLEDFIEGRPREAEAEVSVFTQFDPHDGAPATQPTRAFLSYDSKNLYVGWICKDDPKLIRARLAPRKMIETDDRVTINIDTFADHKHAYWFDVNPYGVQYDGRTTDGIGDDSSWEGLWYSEGRIVSDGYVVLETIPFRTLRFPRADKQNWYITLGRFIERSNEMSLWPAMSHSRSPQFVGQFAPIVIDDNIVPGRNIQMIPYGLLSQEKYLDEDKGFITENQHHPGLDAKMVFDGAFTLDATINPDFSEIGSDDPKVTANQRYEVIFPERRPFFLENASAFQMPEELFFSRRIVTPQFGLKLTGNEGPWSVGALLADDRAPGDADDVSAQNKGKRAYTAVGRLEHEFGHQSHIGLLGEEYRFGSNFNRVASIDWRMIFAKNWAFKGQATTTQAKDPDNGYQAGPGYFLSLRKSDNHLTLSSYYYDRSPGMVATLGYLDRVDIRSWENYDSYQWKPANSALLSWGPTLFTQITYDHENHMQNRIFSPGVSFQLPRMTFLHAYHNESYERYEDTDLRENNTAFSLSASWFKWMDLSSNFSWGKQPNYDVPDGVTPFVGKYNAATTHMTLYGGRRLRLDNLYYYTRLAADEEHKTPTAATVYTNHVVRSKINYQFTRDYSFHAILDYNSMLPNQTLITDSYAKSADATLLFGYLPHPGTAMFIGYSNNFENAIWDESAKTPFQRIQAPSTSTDHQLFIKVSYLLNF